MDGGAWWAAVHGVTKSWTRLSDFTFTFHFHTLEKEMATLSSVLAWRIPGMGKPGAIYGVAQSRTRLKQLSCSSSQINNFLKIIHEEDENTVVKAPGTAGTSRLWAAGSRAPCHRQRVRHR